MTPKQVKIMAAYFEATERLAYATERLLEAHEALRAGLLGNCFLFEKAVKIRLATYRQAREDYENL